MRVESYTESETLVASSRSNASLFLSSTTSVSVQLKLSPEKVLYAFYSRVTATLLNSFLRV